MLDKSQLAVQTICATINGREVSAGVQPKCGANLVSLKIDGREYLHYDEAALLEREFYTGCFIMFPTPCRVPEGRYRFDGREIVQRKRGKLFDIHGLVRDEEFQVSSGDHALRLKLAFSPGHPVYEAFPFRGELNVTMKLVDRGLEYSFEFRNLDERPAPAGFGLHPFWRIPGQRKDMFVRVPCERTMVLENLIPTGATREVAGTPLDLRQPRCLEGLELDCVFLGRRGDDPAAIEYRALGKRMTLRADEVFSHQIVYAPAGQPFVCVENLTTAPNAVNLQSIPAEVSGLRIVGPGEALSGTVHFVVDDL
jgi:aldose 1-epimerase